MLGKTCMLFTSIASITEYHQVFFSGFGADAAFLAFNTSPFIRWDDLFQVYKMKGQDQHGRLCALKTWLYAALHLSLDIQYVMIADKLNKIIKLNIKYMNKDILYSPKEGVQVHNAIWVVSLPNSRLISLFAHTRAWLWNIIGSESLSTSTTSISRYSGWIRSSFCSITGFFINFGLWFRATSFLWSWLFV